MWAQFIAILPSLPLPPFAVAHHCKGAIHSAPVTVASIIHVKQYISIL